MESGSPSEHRTAIRLITGRGRIPEGPPLACHVMATHEIASMDDVYNHAELFRPGAASSFQYLPKEAMINESPFAPRSCPSSDDSKMSVGDPRPTGMLRCSRVSAPPLVASYFFFGALLILTRVLCWSCYLGSPRIRRETPTLITDHPFRERPRIPVKRKMIQCSLPRAGLGRREVGCF